MSEQADAIASIETTLRSAIRLLLPDWRSVVARPAPDRLDERKAQDVRNRPGVIAEDDPLLYMTLPELNSIIIDNFTPFKPVFNDEPQTVALLNTARQVRNAIGHSRPLVSYEQSLVTGIAGWLSNLLTVYRNKTQGDTSYYPVITDARDRFNRTGYEDVYVLGQPRYRIDVGQTVTFTLTADDPKNRTLQWTLGQLKSGMLSILFSPFDTSWPEGNTVTLSWTPDDYWVSELVTVTVAVRSISKFHRHDSYDDKRVWFFAVNPPDEEAPDSLSTAGG